MSRPWMVCQRQASCHSEDNGLKYGSPAELVGRSWLKWGMDRRAVLMAPRLLPIKGKRLSPSPKATLDREDSRCPEANRTACWAVRPGRTKLISKWGPSRTHL